MDRTKKDRPKAATFGQSCPGLASTNIRKIIISNFRQNASPNLDKGGGVFPWSLGLSWPVSALDV